MQRWVRTVAATAGAMLALVLAAGCTPTPEPTPTPTGFANDAEAFRAAEETYRAYVDALNQVDLRDPKTFEPVFAWMTDRALAAEKKSLTTMHADGWTVSGESRISALHKGGRENGGVAMVACLDVGDVAVVDGAGVSQVDPDRYDIHAFRLLFQRSDVSPTQLLIASSAAVEDSRCG